MGPEDVLNLFDSCWFALEIFKKKPSSSTSSNIETIPDQNKQEISPEPKISRQLTIHVRSKSDELISSMTSFASDFLSPDSVLLTPHLQTIYSSKESSEEVSIFPEPKKSRGRRTRTKKSLSKSLSELEFEELKGFMDLGFVFSEEDRNSSLVEIIPGLQRLGKEKDGEKQEEDSKDEKSSIARPYLSEAWDVFEEKQRQNPLLNWRIPALNDEIDLKDSLKWWAHTVASTVR